MDREFSQRKRDLELECQVTHRTFSSAANRLDRFMKPFLTSYRRHEQVAHATTVVQGFCSDLHHKNSESIAYLFGLDHKSIQHFLGESQWKDTPIREELVKQIGSELGKFDGMIAFDPSAFEKSSQQSVGVAR